MRIKAKVIIATLLCAITIGLTGCASLFTPIGDNYYDCNRKENPHSPHCNSFKSVDDATSTSIPNSRYDERADIDAYDKLTGIAPVVKEETGEKPPREALLELDELTSSAQRKPQKTETAQKNAFDEQPIEALHPTKEAPMKEGTPVRVAPTIQATWIKTFVDENGSLIGEQTVYRETTPSHWEGHEADALTRKHGDTKHSATKRRYPHLPQEGNYAANETTANTSSAATTNFKQPGAAYPSSETAVSAERDTTTLPQ